MKKTLLLLALFLLSFPALHAEKPDPSAYTLTAHVVGSSNRGTAAVIEVMIDGVPYELRGGDALGGVLRLGDYKARRLPPAHSKGFADYDSWDRFEFYFPSDGKTREYDVVAVGTAVMAPSSSN